MTKLETWALYKLDSGILRLELSVFSHSFELYGRGDIIYPDTDCLPVFGRVQVAIVNSGVCYFNILYGVGTPLFYRCVLFGAAPWFSRRNQNRRTERRKILDYFANVVLIIFYWRPYLLTDSLPGRYHIAITISRISLWWSLLMWFADGKRYETPCLWHRTLFQLRNIAFQIIDIFVWQS